MFTFAFPKQLFLFWLFSPISCGSSDNNMGTQKIFQNSLYRGVTFSFFLSSSLSSFLSYGNKEIPKKFHIHSSHSWTVLRIWANTFYLLGQCLSLHALGFLEMSLHPPFWSWNVFFNTLMKCVAYVYLEGQEEHVVLNHGSNYCSNYCTVVALFHE